MNVRSSHPRSPPCSSYPCLFLPPWLDNYVFFGLLIVEIVLRCFVSFSHLSDFLLLVFFYLSSLGRGRSYKRFFRTFSSSKSFLLSFSSSATLASSSLSTAEKVRDEDSVSALPISFSSRGSPCRRRLASCDPPARICTRTSRSRLPGFSSCRPLRLSSSSCLFPLLWLPRSFPSRR